MVLRKDKVSTVDPAQVARFDALAEEWWRPDGAFKPVHAFNRARVAHLAARLPALLGRDPRATWPLAGLKMIDVGSGAGLVAEPMSRLGAEVVGIDASARNVEIARRHAQATGAPVRYVHTLPESFGEAGSFDVVISLEVVEHVADRAAFLAATARFVAPDGLLVLGTLNSTVRSFLKAIVGAEYMLGWLPRGTHDWRNFVTPAELRAALAPFGLAEAERCGVVYDPIRRRWRIGQDDSATYLQTFARRVS